MRHMKNLKPHFKKYFQKRRPKISLKNRRHFKKSKKNIFQGQKLRFFLRKTFLRTKVEYFLKIVF